jgi:hypothetical protein
MTNAETDTGPDPEAEAPPPLGLFTPAAPQSEAPIPQFDQWGNIKTEPTNIIEETHGENFVKIMLYKSPGRDAWIFGFQLKIARVVRQKLANITDKPHKGPDAARRAARDMIIDVCRKNHGIKRLFADFTVIRYNQPELF